jgi:hypothetical protein
MAVKELGYRCWVLDYPPGAADDDRHFLGAGDAESSAYPGQGQATARQLTSPCFLVLCDAPGCGGELEHSDYGGNLHVASAAEASQYAPLEGWTAAADGTLSCWGCAHEEAEGA